MTATWKIRAEAELLRSPELEVLTTSQIRAIVIAGLLEPPSPATFARWMIDMKAATKLLEVSKGIYLNRLANPHVSPAAASHFILKNSVPSLSWVMEQAGVTNNFGNTITCIVPTDKEWTRPQTGVRITQVATFHFHSMPADIALSHAPAQAYADVRDDRFLYPRATPEKALLDWIYLGANTRSKMTRPPYDLDLSLLDKKRLNRVVKMMKLEEAFGQWMDQYRLYQSDPEVRENSSVKFRF